MNLPIAAGSEPSMAVDQEGTRWAARVFQFVDKRVVGGRLLVGNLPSTVAFGEYTFRLEDLGGGERPAALLPGWDEFKLVAFAGGNRLLVVAAGLPLLVEIQDQQLKRRPLAVPSPPVRPARYHAASDSLWLTDQGHSPLGYWLNVGPVFAEPAPFGPSLRPGEALGLPDGCGILAPVPGGWALSGRQGDRPLTKFVRLEPGQKPVAKRAVLLPQGFRGATFG